MPLLILFLVRALVDEACTTTYVQRQITDNDITCRMELYALWLYMFWVSYCFSSRNEVEINAPTEGSH
jgi:hypothetical protein